MVGAGCNIAIKDNSGARLIKIIKFYKKTPFSKITVGNLFIGALQKIKMHRKSRLKKLTKKELKRSIIVRLKTKIKHHDGYSIRFLENSAVLVDKKKRPLSTRIIGFIHIELKKKKRFKLVMLAGGSYL